MLPSLHNLQRASAVVPSRTPALEAWVDAALSESQALRERGVSSVDRDWLKRVVADVLIWSRGGMPPGASGPEARVGPSRARGRDWADQTQNWVHAPLPARNPARLDAWLDGLLDEALLRPAAARAPSAPTVDRGWLKRVVKEVVVWFKNRGGKGPRGASGASLGERVWEAQSKSFPWW